MKNTKGFTLIELLAVIVILAIIALIATPMILGVIDSAKKGAAESSAYGYIDSVEKSTLKNMLTNASEAKIVDDTYTTSLEGKTLTADTEKTTDDKAITITVDFKGKNPVDGGKVVVDGGEIKLAQLTINGYKVEYDGKTAKVVENFSTIGE